MSKHDKPTKTTTTTTSTTINKRLTSPSSLAKNSISQDQHYEIPEDGILPGGRLQSFSQYWKSKIHHPWPLAVIQEGYQIQWNSNPHPWKYHPTKFKTLEDQLAVGQAVSKFLAAGIIERSPSQSKEYLSNHYGAKNLRITLISSIHQQNKNAKNVEFSEILLPL
ncbi:hypothetical protein G6F43_013183 [Rhizopus delemar]|nr:hypothetical protein G6F43_013183 [Rhizopus delemar]